MEPVGSPETSPITQLRRLPPQKNCGAVAHLCSVPTKMSDSFLFFMKDIKRGTISVYLVWSGLVWSGLVWSRHFISKRNRAKKEVNSVLNFIRACRSIIYRTN